LVQAAGLLLLEPLCVTQMEIIFAQRLAEKKQPLAQKLRLDWAGDWPNSNGIKTSRRDYS